MGSPPVISGAGSVSHVSTRRRVILEAARPGVAIGVNFDRRGHAQLTDEGREGGIGPLAPRGGVVRCATEASGCLNDCL